MDRDWNACVAPVAGVPVSQKPWEGVLDRKPWEYPITAAIGHRDTPEMLAGVVQLLRAQTVAPYIVVVDTGSGPEARAALEQLDQADDCEVHHLRAKGWRGSSAPVAAAMDLAFSVCSTPFLFGTHTDVFPRKPGLIEYLISLCDARTPAVGWQMSPRVEWPDSSWRSTLSHTASVYHLPTMRRIGAQWSMLGAQDRLGMPQGQTTGGYPDTETCLSLCLAEHGYTPRWSTDPDDGGKHILMLGPEPNAPYQTEWFRHVRSTGSLLIYHRNSPLIQLRRMLVQRELQAIPERLKQWERDRLALRPMR